MRWDSNTQYAMSNLNLLGIDQGIGRLRHSVKLDKHFLGKPAIVSSHRANYVGGMDIDHRDCNLIFLNSLLKKIFTTWPDVEFVSSDELFAMMAH